MSEVLNVVSATQCNWTNVDQQGVNKKLHRIASTEKKTTSKLPFRIFRQVAVSSCKSVDIIIHHHHHRHRHCHLHFFHSINININDKRNVETSAKTTVN